MRRMQMSARCAFGCALAAAIGLSVVSGSNAWAGDTTTTFEVTAGGLSVSVPASKDLGSGVPGGTITSQLGAVTVTDARAQLVAAWTATTSATAFTTGGGTPAETISKANVSYWSGLATATTGIGVFTPGQLTALNAQSLSTSRTAFSLAAGVGNNSASWNPTLIVSVPSAAVTGTYTGTVTHTVA